MKFITTFATVAVAAGLLAGCTEERAPLTQQPSGGAEMIALQQNTQNWAGTWSGVWSGDCTAQMIVKDVTARGAAVVHEYGPCGDLKAGTSADGNAKIEANSMMTTYLGFDIVYTQTGKNSVSGNMTRAGAAVATGDFTRAE